MKLTRRQILRLGTQGTIAAGVGALGWARFIEPDWLKVEHVELPLRRLPRAFDGFKIAQISDLHIESGSMAHDWPSIAALVTSHAPDLICLTGDYISAHDGNWSPVVAEGLKLLKAPCGVFATLGNHDHYTGVTPARRALKMAGVRELRNEVHFIHRGEAKLSLAGVDDLMVGQGDLSAVSPQIPPETCTVLLCHEPDYADWAAPTGKYDLMLSGHSHGGQICLPLAGALILPPMGRKYWKGLYEIGPTKLYTSRGLGMVGMPLRFNARPEITIFTLKTT